MSITRIQKTKIYSFIDQFSSSVSNFVIFLLLMRIDGNLAVFYSLTYSISLIFFSILKCSVLNSYISSGINSFSFILRHLLNYLFSPYFILCFSFFICFLLYSNISISIGIIFFYYILMDFLRVYFISVSNYKILVCLSLFLSFISPCLLYLIGREYGMIFVFLFQLILLISIIIYLFLNDKVSSHDFQLKSNDKDGVFITILNSVFVHFPLWFLSFINPLAAQLYLMVRNLFQPFQIISRSIDLIDKKNHSRDSLISPQDKLRTDLPLSLLFLLINALVAVFFFNSIYSKDFSNYIIIASVLPFSLLAYLLHVLRFFENPFFARSNQFQMIEPKFYSSIFLLAMFGFCFFLSLDYFYLYILIICASYFVQIFLLLKKLRLQVEN